MNEHTQLLRIKKLKGGGIVLASARHNLREIQAEQGADSHIDVLRSPLNVVLRGASDAATVANMAVQLMTQAKVKRRKDEVLGLELLISLRASSGINERAFFDAAVIWAGGFFEIPILSAVIHNDESVPHCHIVMLPLFDGRMIGSALVGNKERLTMMQADFFEKVGQPYGLARPTPTQRFSHAAKAKGAALAIGCLVRNPKLLNEPTVRDALRDAVTCNPMPVMAALNLDMPQNKKPRPKTFVDIMTKPFKLEKPIGFKRAQDINPIGFTPVSVTGEGQSLSCVGFAQNEREFRARKKGRAQEKASQVLAELAAGISKQVVADSLGIGIASVYRILSGAKKP